MNVLHIVAGEFSGGATKGAYNLHLALLEQNITSHILTSAKDTLNDSSISNYNKYKTFFYSKLDSTISKLCGSGGRIFSNNFAGVDILNSPHYKNADIIHLHWINSGFISLKTISRIKKPIVWSIRDMWVFTGGCHYAMGENLCFNYQIKCNKCPTLHSKSSIDLSYLNFYLKSKLYPKHTHFIAISEWIKECAKNSSLLKEFNITTIPNCIDIDSFTPIDKNLARDILNIKTNKKILLCGANSLQDFYKGFGYFLDLLEILPSDKYFLCFFGKLDTRLIKNFEFKSFGYQNSPIALRLIYSAADIFIAPSVLEAFGKTIAESMACKTPVIAFDYSGPRDIISHLYDGYLAKSFDIDDLARGIEWILGLDSNAYQALSINARESVVEKFSFTKVAKEYIKVYNSMLNGGGYKLESLLVVALILQDLNIVSLDSHTSFTQRLCA